MNNIIKEIKKLVAHESGNYPKNPLTPFGEHAAWTAGYSNAIQDILKIIRDANE